MHPNDIKALTITIGPEFGTGRYLAHFKSSLSSLFLAYNNLELNLDSTPYQSVVFDEKKITELRDYLNHLLEK
jgi:hypothetical protein